MVVRAVENWHSDGQCVDQGHSGGYDDSLQDACGQRGRTKSAHPPGLFKDLEVSTTDISRPRRSRLRQRLFFAGQILLFGIIVIQFTMLYRSYAFAAAAAGMVDAAALKRQGSMYEASSSSNVPDYFITKPELLPGK